MNNQEKLKMFNRIVADNNTENRKQEMYNRIITNTPIQSRQNFLSSADTSKYSLLDNTREKFKSALEKKKKEFLQGKLNKATPFTKAQVKFRTSTTGENENNVFENIIKERRELENKKAQDAVQNQKFSVNDRLKYWGNSLKAGVVGGITGLYNAGSSEIQNNLLKGSRENKGIEGTVSHLTKGALSLINPQYAISQSGIGALKDGINLIKDKQSSPLEKIVKHINNSTTNAVNFIPGKNALDEITQASGNAIQKATNDGENIINKGFNFINNKVNNPYRNMQNQVEDESRKHDNATKVFGNALNSIGYMAPSVAASAIGGPTVGLLTTGISSKGTSTQEALQKGAELDEAVKIGNTKGLTEAGTELISGGVKIFGKGALDDIVEKGILSKVKNKVGRFLLREGYDYGGEIGEEVISDLVGTLVDKGTVEPEKTYSVSDLGETAVTTMLTTAVLKALGVPINVLNNKNFKNQNSESNVQKNNSQNLAETKKNNYNNVTNHINDKMTQKPSSSQNEEGIQNIPKFNENIDKNSGVVYNNHESEGGVNEQIQQRGMLEGNNSLSGISKNESQQKRREYTRHEYEQWEQSVKPITRENYTDEQKSISEKVKKQYDKDIAFFNGKNNIYNAGASYINKKRINVDSEQVKEFGLNKVIYHEIAESDILHNQELKKEYIDPILNQIIDDPNFEQQKQEFWKSEDSPMPNDYLIAKDILCDRFAELKTGEKIDYNNVLSQSTNMNMDFGLNQFHNQLYGRDVDLDEKENNSKHEFNLETPMKNKAQNYLKKSKSQFINDLVSDLQTSKFSNKEILNQSVDEIINEINNNDGKVSKEKADELFDNLYSRLLKTDSDFYEQYKDLKEDIRKTKLFVPENVEKDISDFGEFRKNNRGNLVLTNDNSNVNIDTKYKELSETYPELFPSEITNQSDQLQKISEVVRDIKKTETNVQAYLDKNMGPDYKMWAREDFNRILDKFQRDVNLAYRYNAENSQKSNFIIAKDELKEMYKSLPQLKKNYEKVMNAEVLTERDRVQVDRLLKNEITIDELPNGVNKKGIINVFNAKQPLNIIQESIKENKKNIRELRLEQAQKDLGDLSKWKDKKMGWFYSRETASRNIYDIAPKEIAKKIDNDYIQQYHVNEARAVRTINKYTDEIKNLKLSSQKKYKATFSMQEILDGELKDVVKTKKVSEAELVQIFGEGRITLDQLQETGVDTQKIIKSVETFRNIYDQLFDDVNEILLNNGLEPVQKRANYFPHFSEAEPDNLLSKAAKLAGIDLTGELLPTDIAGKTQNFKPNKKFVGNFLQRSTDITDFNALKGFDRYIQGVTDVIYHTEDIMKFRALSDSIRSFYSTKEIKTRIENIQESTELTPEEKNEKINEIKEQTVNKSNLSNFITWLDNYINILAGKKSINDRASEKELSRKVYKAMNKIESRIGANMVAGNIGVSFTNLAPLAQASAECSVPNLVKGLYGSMIANGKAMIGKRDTSFASESDFITRRRGTETTSKSLIDKVTKPLDIITSSIDDVISEGIVRARYIQNLKSGMTQQEALHEADTYSAGLMADRSKGALPTQFYSTNPLAKMVNMFQIEVNNQFSYYFKDMKRNIGNTTNSKAEMAAKMTKSYAKLLIASYAMNELISKTRGNATRVLPDPIYIVKELIKGLGNDDKDDDWETLNGTIEEILGNTPFASVPIALFGNAFGLDSENIGRVSISGAIPDVSKIGSTLLSDADSEYKKETLRKEAEKPLYNLLFPKARFTGKENYSRR